VSWGRCSRMKSVSKAIINSSPLDPIESSGKSLLAQAEDERGSYTFTFSDRHPGYTGVWMIIAGMFVWNCSPGSWVAESGVMRTLAGKIGAIVCTGWLFTLGE
jgi:hypothetical protein